jgi:hypothetical protein
VWLEPGGGGSPGFVVVFIGMNGSSRFSKKKIAVVPAAAAASC